MRKQKNLMENSQQNNKKICPACMGNGYVLINSWDNYFQCDVCDSQGEISLEEFKKIEERKNNEKETTRI
jgi:RecJ-like exonuclease|tara:strand:+ start:988 stop:1197 length:210 start_codon:yes stop_codon:yes gene_type:complete